MGVRRTILMYHRVATESNDPFSLCVSPEHFAEQLEDLHRLADVVTIDNLRSKSARPRVAVTFDDGYADNLHNALPVAERLGIPITVFVTSRSIGRPEGFWWDRLTDVLAGREEVDVKMSVANAPLRIQLQGRDAGQRALEVLHRRLRPLPVPHIERVMGELASEFGIEAARPSPARSLEQDELLQLASSPLVAIGAHTTEHVFLRCQPFTEQFRTITQSKTDLEGMLGQPVVHFAYPFGGVDSFDKRSMEVVRRAGFRSACTSVPGVVTKWSNSFCLPRRMVRDWDGGAFREQLGTWGIS